MWVMVLSCMVLILLDLLFSLAILSKRNIAKGVSQYMTNIGSSMSNSYNALNKCICVFMNRAVSEEKV